MWYTGGKEIPYYNCFRLLSEQLSPSFIVEIGSFQGTAAAHFAHGAPGAIVVTIDIHKDEQIHNEIERTQEAAAQYSNLYYVNKWSWDAGPDVQSIGGDLTIDILYVDGWHEYDKIQREWLVFEPMLSNEALVIFDDMDPKSFPGVVRFWDELKGRRKIIDNDLHLGIPMGFYIFERK
jgi:predicted O-methyltransferase YrrM